MLTRSIRSKSGLLAIVLAFGLAACEPADERAQGHLENGLKLAEEGDTARALLEFREATRLDANLADAYIEIARIRQREGNLQSAVGHYTKAVEVDETNLPARVELGRIMLLAGQLDDALRYSMAAVQLAPNDVEALTLRASVALQVENYDLAQSSAEQAMRIDPSATQPYAVLAAIALRNDDYEGAMVHVDQGLERDAKDLPLNVFKIQLLERMDRREEVPPILKLLTEAYPERNQFRSALIRWHLSRGEKDEAEALVRAYAAERPDESNAALAVVQFLMKQRGEDAARAELEDVLKAKTDKDARFPFEMALMRMDLAKQDTEAASARLKSMIAAHGDTENGDTARVRLAALELAQANEDAARQLVDDVLSHDARNSQALAIRAQLKLNNDQYDAAIQDARLAIAEEPDNWRYLMLEAQAHELNGAQSLVGERLATAAQASEYASTPVLAYARHLRGTNKNEFAESLVENALRRHPNDAALLRALAQIKLDLKDWIGAEDIAARIRDIEGGDQLADFIDARSLAGQEQREESIKLLESIHSKGDNSRSSMAALVSSYLRSNQPERARTFLQDILKEQPENLTALKLKGDLHTALSELDQAEQVYKDLLEKAPNASAAYTALTNFYIRTGRLEDAKAIAKAGAEKTDGAGIKVRYAQILENQGDYAGAVEIYQELYDSRPQSFVVANNLASLLIDHFPTEENIERAYNVAKRLRSSEVPQYQDTYGWALYLRGEPEQALRYLQPAAERLPNIMLVQYHLGMAYAKAGVNDRAKEALEKAVELAGDEDSAQKTEAMATLEGLKETAAANQ